MRTRVVTFGGGVAVVVVCALAVSARAQAQPTFEHAKPEEAAEVAKVQGVEWKASAQAGLVMTTGNSRSTSFSGGGTASRKAGNDKFQLEAGAVYVTADVLVAADGNGNGTIEEGEISRAEATTSEAWSAKVRYDRFLTEQNALFAAARILADQPAGKELLGGGQVGYSRLLIKTDAHQVTAEVGYDFTYEDYVATGDAVNIHSARVFAGYAGKLTPNTGVEGSVETLVNLNKEDTPTGEVDAFEDTRVVGKAALTAQLFEDIAFRFGFTLQYDQAPAPAPPFALPYAAGFVPLADEVDTKTEATLIINFL
jgi:putative salt-induced outer membrane protein YdiY